MPRLSKTGRDVRLSKRKRVLRDDRRLRRRIGGAAAALALQREGFDVVVLESDAAFDARKQVTV